MNYYIIIVVYDIKLSKMLLDFLLVMTNLHISLEAVEWRLVQVTFDLLRLKYVFLNSPILLLNMILHMLYILTLYITYPSYSIVDYVII